MKDLKTSSQSYRLSLRRLTQQPVLLEESIGGMLPLQTIMRMVFYTPAVSEYQGQNRIIIKAKSWWVNPGRDFCSWCQWWKRRSVIHLWPSLEMLVFCFFFNVHIYEKCRRQSFSNNGKPWPYVGRFPRWQPITRAERRRFKMKVVIVYVSI